MSSSEVHRILDYLDSDDESNESEDFDDDIVDPDFCFPDQNELSGMCELDSDNEEQDKILVLNSDTDEHDGILIPHSNTEVQDEIISDSNTEEAQELPIVTKVKKRIRKPESWKRNISKKND